LSELQSLIVVGSGEASAHQPGLFDAKVRATVRYADPAAWITATAVSLALAGSEDLLAEWRHQIGIIAVSDQGPGKSIESVQTAATTGFSSPLHYAASSPGTLVGVSCIAFGLRGPTLNLTMDPQDGVSVAIDLCAAWLARKAAPFMIVATCRTSSSGAMKSHAVLLAPSGFSGSGTPLTESLIAWLAAVDPATGVDA
jgi:hypothetical protein